jgi:hypothetical protein
MCALIMYALWAKKPQNVQFSTLVEFGDNRELLALLVQNSEPLPGSRSSDSYALPQFDQFKSSPPDHQDCDASVANEMGQRFENRPGENSTSIVTNHSRVYTDLNGDTHHFPLEHILDHVYPLEKDGEDQPVEGCLDNVLGADYVFVKARSPISR